MRKLVLAVCLFVFPLIPTLPLLADEDLLQKSQALFKPIPDSAPELENNPITPQKVELGKMLFFEPRLSASNLISCNTCHNLGTGGVDLQETSVGHAWQRGPRNAPTVLNSVFNIAQFWDGRAKNLAEQAKGPVQATVEMNNSPEGVIETLNSMPEYVALFTKSFPESENPVSFDNTVKAIEAFEATLLTPNSRFDQYLGGNQQALNAEEKEGLKLFVDKGCAGCHNGINLGGNGYFPFGLVQKPGADILPPDDKGRFAITNTESDKFSFKVPTLRDIQLTPPYFHSGKIWSLKQAVGVMGTAQLGIELTDEDVDKITAFLLTLTGDQPKIEYPILPPNTDGTPKPILEVLKEKTTEH